MNLQKNNKKNQPHGTCTTHHTRNTCWTSNAQNRLTPSQATMKQEQAATATTITTTKITIFILTKIEGRLCCCGFLCKSDHEQPSRVKRAKRKRRFLHSWTTISILQTPSYLVGNSNFQFQFLGPPSEAEFRFRFWFQRFRSDFFLNSAVEKLTNRNSDSEIQKSEQN